MIDYGFYNMDCMDGMREFPDKFFDIAVVDPPYFSGPEKRQFYGRRVSPIGVQRLYGKTDCWEIRTRHILMNCFVYQKIKLFLAATTLIILLVPGVLFGINATGNPVSRIVKLPTVVFMIL